MTDPSHDAGSHPGQALEKLEIERKFLLRAVPEIPESLRQLVTRHRIEQGYLGMATATLAEDQQIFTAGRVRRITHPDGRIECIHTVKTGLGLIRVERETPLTANEFECVWPSTEGRRIQKVRWRCPVGESVWEIDIFDGLELVLAEVELPHVEARVEPPEWIRAVMVREVTDDPRFTNYQIACTGGVQGGH
jgi:adenylate cyclase